MLNKLVYALAAIAADGGPNYTIVQRNLALELVRVTEVCFQKFALLTECCRAAPTSL